MEKNALNQVMNQVYELLDEANLNYVLVVTDKPSDDGSYHGYFGLNANKERLDNLSDVFYDNMTKSDLACRFFELLAYKVFSPIAKRMSPKQKDININFS